MTNLNKTAVSVPFRGLGSKKQSINLMEGYMALTKAHPFPSPFGD